MAASILDQFSSSEDDFTFSDQVEAALETNPPTPWEPAGPVTYAMTLEEIDTLIKKKFQELAKEGRLLPKPLFEATFNPNDFIQKSPNLTRIFGELFLKESTSFNVPRHYILFEEGRIEVELWSGTYPALSILKNCEMVAEKIEGEKAASQFAWNPELKKVGYADFSDPGNILVDATDRAWIVDTEVKSFDPPSYRHQFYLQERFAHLTGSHIHRFQVTPPTASFV